MHLDETVADMFDFAHRQLDRVAPPEFRQNAFTTMKTYYAEHPLSFSFIVVQVIFASMPVLCFIAFALSVFFAFATAFLFMTLFWAGLAFCILIPVLLVTFGMALFTWGFAVAVFHLSRLAYTAWIPISAGNRGGLRESRPNYEKDYPSFCTLQPSGTQKDHLSPPAQDEQPGDKEEGLTHGAPGSDLNAPDR
ncbi:uncharacterized protein B0H64DRAFT_119227 [Chaetomium fimeti]|uniref:Uncharacterized protein n=1 Tax=Chaetomium fimeti TaxID=1854472 RepID=A0AAE0HIF4_9PEZI|nr:hypothetical protein B0H64DRAFT_119227 [Chaetomium fimeti]